MGKFHKEKLEIMKKYIRDIVDVKSYDLGDNVPESKLGNAKKYFASGLEDSSVLGFYDTSIWENGKNGYIFTDDKIYYLESFEKPKKLWYEDIKSMEITKTYKKDCDRELWVTLNDGSKINFDSCFLRKTSLMNFLNEIKDFDVQEIRRQQKLSYSASQNAGSIASGLGVSNYQTVNNQYNEEKFHARQGHGWAAERANNMYDKFTGHDAKIVGDDNAKNGADRIMDGVSIQSKYCKTGRSCVNACFENNGSGSFRYMADGKPMQIEVPSDNYDEAVKVMEEKIRRGQVKGVSDPEEAKNIIRKGHFTYQQARNIAKAGTIESLTYDAANGAVIATSAFGVTALITLATSVWNGKDFDEALKLATYSGLKVGGTAFITSILVGQLSKAGLNSALVGSSEAIMAIMGPKASAILINAFREGSKNIYGAAAMKSAAKLLRGNVITAGVTIVVLSAFDVANIFQGRISGKQLFKNFTNTAATVGGGTGGWLAGAAAGSAILPGIGTFVGALAGSMIGGAAAGKVTNSVVGAFIEDDADEMVEIIRGEFKQMCEEYLLSHKEAEKSVDRLKEKLDGKMLKDMYASSNKEKFARNLLTPIVERQVVCRSFIPSLTENQMVASVREVLEEIADAAGNNRSLVNA